MPAPRSASPSPSSADQPLPRRIARPLREFLDQEMAGGIALLVALIAALVWANSPWAGSYESFWQTELTLRIGAYELSHDLRHWVNDGLMTLFFFVVGLEIKREVITGELSGLRRVALPAIAALGGMLAPALVYILVIAGGEGASGFGIPMATDIALSLGVLALLGPRVPPALKLFLLSLAIVDDVGAILLIAAFYSHGIHWEALAIAVVLAAGMAAIRFIGVRWVPVYVLIGTAIWLATFNSGVHATLAGVVIAFLTPVYRLSSPGQAPAEPMDQWSDDQPTPEQGRERIEYVRESVPVGERMEHLLHPWTSLGVVPFFVLANAGVALSGTELVNALGSRITYGVALGLVVGKMVGISLAVWLAVRSGVARLPEEVGWRGIVGAAALAGIGFTVSLFIADLAFDSASLVSQAKVGILGGSLVASVLGALILRREPAPSTPQQKRSFTP